MPPNQIFDSSSKLNIMSEKLQIYKEYLFRRLFANFHKILIFFTGVGLASFGLYFSYYRFLLVRISPTSHDAYVLKSKISKAYKKYKGLVRMLPVDTKTIVDKTGVEFNINFMDKLDQKPTLKQNQQKADPFLPPFDEGQFICELGHGHNLLFNKYAVVKHHLLVVSKNFEDQEEILNRDDFAAIIRAMRSVGGFAFFNCGEFSGQSIPHKHIQIVPYVEKLYPILSKISLLSKQNNFSNSDRLPFFSFKHTIKQFDHFHDENTENAAKYLELLFRQALTNLDYFTNKSSYNMILSEDWIFIVVRRKEKLWDSISLNSMAFTGNILIKSKEDWDRLEIMHKSIDILGEISEQY